MKSFSGALKFKDEFSDNSEKRELYLKLTHWFLNRFKLKYCRFDSEKELFRNCKIDFIDYDESLGNHNNFKFKSLPDYRFGLWWNLETHVEKEYEYIDNHIVEKDTKNVDYFIGNFFGDFEEEIDKFKPWRCHFNVIFKIKKEEFLKHLEDDSAHVYAETILYSDPWNEIADIVNFIIKEPYLAFCQSYCNWNLNYEYHTREEAEKEYKEYLEYKEEIRQGNNNTLKEKFNVIHTFLSSKGLVQFKDYFIKDDNYNEKIIHTSPEYSIYLKATKDEEAELYEDNCYLGLYCLSGLFAINEEDVCNTYTSLRNEFEEIEKKYFLSPDISLNYNLVTRKKFNQMKNCKYVVDITRPELYYKKKEK